MQSVPIYHHWCFEFESRSGRDVQHYVIKFVSDLRQWFSPDAPVSSTNKTDHHDITEILLKVVLKDWVLVATYEALSHKIQVMISHNFTFLTWWMYRIFQITTIRRKIHVSIYDTFCHYNIYFDSYFEVLEKLSNCLILEI